MYSDPVIGRANPRGPNIQQAVSIFILNKGVEILNRIIKYMYLLSLILLFVTGCSSSSNKPAAVLDNKIKDTPQETQSIRIAGSGSNIPLTQKILDEYAKKSGVHINIPVSIGTIGAVKALQDNQLELGLISRELKDSEKQSGLKQKSYGKIGIVFGVHGKVPDDNIGSEDLLNIYKGTKTTWSNGKNIIVLAREIGDSSNAVLEKSLPSLKNVLDEALNSKRWDIYYTDQEANDAIVTIPNSFGITDTVAIKMQTQIKPLKFNGVEATLDNIQNQSYPFNKNLYFAYKEPLSAQTKHFLDFVYSDEGQAIISNNGGLPLKGE